MTDVYIECIFIVLVATYTYMTQSNTRIVYDGNDPYGEDEIEATRIVNEYRARKKLNPPSIKEQEASIARARSFITYYPSQSFSK
jgi:hypothetical protein